MEDLDINLVIDTEKAIKLLGGEQLYRLMLPMYEGTSLITPMMQLAKEVETKNWEQMRFYAHALKGPAGYIGASRLHYACYYV